MKTSQAMKERGQESSQGLLTRRKER